MDMVERKETADLRRVEGEDVYTLRYEIIAGVFAQRTTTIHLQVTSQQRKWVVCVMNDVQLPSQPLGHGHISVHVPKSL